LKEGTFANLRITLRDLCAKLYLYTETSMSCRLPPYRVRV